MIVRGERSRTVVVDSDKKGDDENYCIIIAVVPPLSQYNHNMHLTYCNTICKSQNFLNSHPCSVPSYYIIMSGVLWEYEVGI